MLWFDKDVKMVCRVLQEERSSKGTTKIEQHNDPRSPLGGGDNQRKNEARVGN